MARLRGRIERAAALHRHTAALAAAAGSMLDAYSPAAAPVEQYAEQHSLAAALRTHAASLAPGWLGAHLDALALSTPLGGPLPPTFVRVGQAHPLDDASFPVVVPLLRAGHVAIDADGRDSRVAGLLRSLVLRLLASSPPGSVRIRTVDAAEIGATFARFTGIDAIMPPPVTDAEGLRTVLDEGERWLAARSGDGAGPTLLVVIASLPELTEGRDLARIAALAHAGPAGRLHLIAAGWPPPPLTAETTQAPLPHATQIAIRNPHAWVGDPPGATFSGTGIGPSRLNAPVFLDPDPPAELIRAVCAQLAGPWASPPSPVAEPSRTAWLEYVASAQRLDAVRREAAAVVAEHKTALKAARADLAGVLTKLKHHQAQLVLAAKQAGSRPVDLTPTWQDTQTVQHVLAGSQPRRRGAPVEPPPVAPVSAPSAGVLMQPTGEFPMLSSGSAPTHQTGPIPTHQTGPIATHHTGPIRTQQTGSVGTTTTGWMPAQVSGPPRAPLSVPPGRQVSGMPGGRPTPVSGAQAAPPTSPPPAGASPVPGSVPGRVSAALRASGAALIRSEAMLSGTDQPATHRPLRNVVVYFLFALLAAAVQLPMLFAATAFDAGVLAIPCGLVLPAMAFGLGWLTIGALSKGSPDRTPLAGGAISLLALIPLLAGLLFLA